MLRSICICIAIIGSLFSGGAQTAAPALELMLAPGRLGPEIDLSVQPKIDGQLYALLNQSIEQPVGFSAFIVYPSLSILEKSETEGTPVARTNVQMLLTLRLVHIFTSNEIANKELRLDGSGVSLQDAVNRCVLTLGAANIGLTNALNGFRTKAAAFFTEQCDAIRTDATEQASQKRSREAFVLLHGLPKGAACYADVQTLKKEVFEKFEKSECNSLVTKAKTASAAKEMEDALMALSQIDFKAPCFESARTLAADLETKVDPKLKTRYESLFQFYAKGVESEAARADAIKAIAAAWLKEKRIRVVVK